MSDETPAQKGDGGLLEGFRAAHQAYEAAVAKVVEAGAAKEPQLAAKCGVGEVCHGGSF